MNIFTYIAKIYAGRLNRSYYILGQVITIATFLGLSVVVSAFSASGEVTRSLVGGAFFLLVGVAYMVFIFSLHVRRIHDLNHAGWLAIVCLVPGINIIPYLYLIFAPGDPKPNQYGERPPKNAKLLDVILKR